jgi:hypothetical protein
MKQLFQTTAMAVMIALSMYGLLAFKAKSEEAKVYEYRQFSTVESVVSGGMGRSRMVSTDAKGSLVEKELLNFYSLVGINFGNVVNNYKLIVDKINEYTSEGWELYTVTAGVHSPAEGKGGTGIFLTRYLFRKAK